MIGQLEHFFKRVDRGFGDEGDDTFALDCWENRDPEKMTGWSLMNIPWTGNMVFAGIYAGDVRDGQWVDEYTKVTDVSHINRDTVKVTSSAIRGTDPYHFCIIVNIVQYPFEAGQLIGSLIPNNWTTLVGRLEVEQQQGLWNVAAPTLASKLSRVVAMVDILHIETPKVALETPRRQQGLSDLTGSPAGSSASGRASTARAKPRKSNLQNATPKSPAKKRDTAKKASPQSRKKSKHVLEEDEEHNLATLVAGLPNNNSKLGDDLSSVNSAWSTFWTECTDAYVAADTEKKLEIEISDLKNAPADWTCRSFEKTGVEFQRNYLVNLSDFNNRQSLCVMPDMAFKPASLDAIPDGTQFWIINGQHSVAASHEIVNDSTLKEMIKKHFRTWKCFVVWSKDKVKLQRISAYYNRCNHLKMFKPSWATNILGARQIWINMGRPKSKKISTAVRGSRATSSRTREQVVNDEAYKVRSFSNRVQFSSTRAKLQKSNFVMCCPHSFRDYVLIDIHV